MRFLGWGVGDTPAFERRGTDSAVWRRHCLVSICCRLLGKFMIEAVREGNDMDIIRYEDRLVDSLLYFTTSDLQYICHN